MQDDARLLSEDELALIHALQLQPRGSWTDLGRALDVDPVTVARRWSRLAERGQAWIGLSPGPRICDQVCAAFVEIDCLSGSTDGVVRTLCAHPHMLTIERSAGDHSLLATVAAADLRALSRYTLDVLQAIPGVTAVHARIITHMFTEGGHWRIDALAPTQSAQLATPARPLSAGQGPQEITAFDRTLLGHLAHDGRASYQSLAAAVGTSTSTVKRRIDQLTRLGLLRFRCDFARPLGGWPVAVTFRAKVPPADLPDIGHALVRLPETRNCAAISGPHNLILQASLHSVADVVRFEAHLAAAHPTLDVVQREITLRHDKLLGHTLDPHGRSLGVVAPDVWCEPTGTPG
ncbi:Lrp/AsnC family transcriptional regulator [Kitasatospora aureofaciens]|uniref:Lrp/AsnC family transcriptional regulator n=1 Tax=Kitasatospora aureofaciens TaxID=1894 RepID=UPI001C48ABA2|nr:Lrp/AsnC family transcriptional regulator [Kitasatospora aureofaciens]MBV6702033.1 Lrp/AsnC family transcriptional regulator [Kitasatospora aureofaciens]